MCHPTVRGVACVLSTKAKGFKFLDVVVVEVWNPNRPGGLIYVVCRGTVAWAMGFTLYTYTGKSCIRKSTSIPYTRASLFVQVPRLPDVEGGGSNDARDLQRRGHAQIKLERAKACLAAR